MLNISQRELQNALTHIGRGCTYTQMLTVINTIVSVTTGNYAAMLSIVDGYAKIQDPKGDTFVGAVKEVYIVGKGLSDILDNCNKLLHAIGGNPEGAKLVLHDDDYTQKSEELNEALAKLPVSPEKENFSRALHSYKELIQTKNEKELEYTKALSRIRILTAEKDQRSGVIADARNALATAKDPTLSVLKVFLESAYGEMRDRLAEILHMENRAFEYWSLTERPLSLRDYRIATLRKAQADLENDVTDSKAKTFEAGNILTDWITIDIAELVGKNDFAQFKAGQKIRDAAGEVRYHTLTFTINSDVKKLSRWNALRLTALRIRIPNIQTHDDSLQYSVIHHGVSQLIAPDGRRRRYVHPKRKYTMGYNIPDGHPITEEKISILDPEFLAPSPFAVWTLIIGDRQNPGLSLTHVTSITMSLKGRYLS